MRPRLARQDGLKRPDVGWEGMSNGATTQAQLGVSVGRQVILIYWFDYHGFEKKLLDGSGGAVESAAIVTDRQSSRQMKG